MLYWVVLIGGWLLFAIWLYYVGPLIPALWGRWLVARTNGLSDPAPWLKLSVIVPARDEGRTIETGLRSLIDSDYPNLEIIAVDDRSTDETGAIMDRLSASDPRLKVVHVTQLPEGWLGKNHAMHVASQHADGDWLLFTDGDIIYEPPALRLAVKYAHHRRLDHLCLNPQFIPGGYVENALVCYFGLLFLGAAKPWLIPTSYRGAYVGIGAFNMLRRTAYDMIGGHEPLRLDVLDDLHLGKLVKQSGFRQDLLSSGDLIRVRWQHSLWGVICGLEKNCFASLSYSLPLLILFVIYMVTVTAAPYFAICLLRDSRVIPYAAALLLRSFTYGYLGHCSKVGWRVWPMLPVSTVLLLFAFCRSAYLTLKQGGVRWRDTFYPLELLRANQYLGTPRAVVRRSSSAGTDLGMNQGEVSSK